MKKHCRSPLTAGFSGTSPKIREIMRQAEEFKLTPEQLQEIIESRSPFTWPLVREQIRQWTRYVLETKLGQEIDVPPLPGVVTEKLYMKLGAFNMRPAFFPRLDVSQNFKLPGYKKPYKIFYEKISEGIIVKETTKLNGQWVFVDYTHATGIYKNDPLTPLIKQLRKIGKIKKMEEFRGVPNDSRYNIKHTDWSDVIAPAFAELIGVLARQVRLLRVIESNFVVNIYDKIFSFTNEFDFYNDRCKNNSAPDSPTEDVYLCGNGFTTDWTTNDGSGGWIGAGGGRIAGRFLVEFL